MGPWNFTTNKYDYIDYDNINRTINNTENLLIRWGKHKAFAAFEPVNEPWFGTDTEVLKQFYRDTRKLV
mgnify:CR=1 FL=1